MRKDNLSKIEVSIQLDIFVDKNIPFDETTFGVGKGNRLRLITFEKIAKEECARFAGHHAYLHPQKQVFVNTALQGIARFCATQSHGFREALSYFAPPAANVETQRNPKLQKLGSRQQLAIWRYNILRGNYL